MVRAAVDLQPDLRLVFLRALATRPDDRSTLTARLRTVMPIIDRSERVVRRRLDDANLQVAAKLQQTAAGDRGWFLGALDTYVDLGDDQPIYRGDHTIVVTADSLETITEKISVPGAGADVAPSFAASGHARLETVQRIHQQTWEFTLRLDRTYLCGDEVTYQSSLRLASRADAPPMSVMAPQRDCRHFSTTVNLAGLAECVWVLDGVTPPTVNDDTPMGVVIDVAAVPQPSVAFENLTPGLIYGLRWRWAAGAYR